MKTEKKKTKNSEQNGHKAGKKKPQKQEECVMEGREEGGLIGRIECGGQEEGGDIRRGQEEGGHVKRARLVHKQESCSLIVQEKSVTHWP